tara:strand:- start:917 stop:1186 length:270 start_codon:yes stop_codon:yes gene_type:complete
MKRNKALDKVKKLISVERAIEHGDMHQNFLTISKYWSNHLGVDVSINDVSVMMSLLKIARIKSNKKNLDNYFDAIGYLALSIETLDSKE